MKKFIYSLVFILCFNFSNAFSQSDWVWQNPFPNGNVLYNTKFVDANTGWAVGYFELMKTTNGGINWFSQAINTTAFEINVRVFPISANNVWVSSAGGIYRSTNGGANWEAQVNPTTNAPYSLYFANMLTGWGVGDNGTILTTINGGTNWFVQPSGITEVLRDVQFFNITTGYTAGNYGKILKTTNG